MRTIKIDGLNTAFDATLKAYGSLDLLSKVIRDNGGNINILPINITYDDLISQNKSNQFVTTSTKLSPTVSYLKTFLQTEFDIVTNVCIDLNNLANILKDNSISLGGTISLFAIKKTYISDRKASDMLSGLKKRFNTGFSQKQTGSFLLQENGFYLLQENGYKIKL